MANRNSPGGRSAAPAIRVRVTRRAIAGSRPTVQVVDTSAPSQPILRWAGGKRWLASRIADLFPDLAFRDYHEPFLGGAAIFLRLKISGTPYLSDLNEELIATYRTIRDAPDEVADTLRLQPNNSEHYYEMRNSSPTCKVQQAARFLYLNHTSFNGIYRVNLKGEYNVPYGRRLNPSFPTHEQLRAISRKLEMAHLATGDFTNGLDFIKQGDLVFLDPPYTVAHNNNGFIKYNQSLFSFNDQRRLSRYIDTIRSRGAYYIMTNAAHTSIDELFEKGDRRLELTRGSSVGGKLALRGSAKEYLFTNVGKNDG